MELPGGQIVRTTFGGEGILQGIIGELANDSFNGFVRASIFRVENLCVGSLVFKQGKPVLAEHKGETLVSGADAVKEILRDSVSPKCIVELHSYDYATSSIRVSYLEKNFPEAGIGSMPELGLIAHEVEEEERVKKEKFETEQEERRRKESTLLEKEEELYRKKWELEKDYEKSSEARETLAKLKEELAAVKEGSLAILKHLSERKDFDAMAIAEKKLGEAKLEAARKELEVREQALEERERELRSMADELSKLESFMKGREEDIDRSARSSRASGKVSCPRQRRARKPKLSSRRG
jgi:hypothetical protein